MEDSISLGPGVALVMEEGKITGVMARADDEQAYSLMRLKRSQLVRLVAVMANIRPIMVGSGFDDCLVFHVTPGKIRVHLGPEELPVDGSAWLSLYDAVMADSDLKPLYLAYAELALA